MLKSFVKIAAAAALFVGAGPALAQVQSVDPDQPDSWNAPPRPRRPRTPPPTT